MWICPRCGRKFRRINQRHHCEKEPTTVEEYIAAQKIEYQPLLNELRSIIIDTVPDVVETISWRMPTLRNERVLIQFALHTKHLAFYVGEAAVEHFAEELKDYRTYEGTIRFSLEEELPEALIVEIARWLNQL